MRVIKVSFFLGFMALLTACGFQPVYGTKANAVATEQALKTVEIGNIADRRGQKLRNFLIDHMYGSGALDSRYHLSISLDSRTSDLGIRKDDTATRAQLRLTATYQMTDLKTGEMVTSGKARSLVSYNILESQYGTLVNEDDAEDRALRDVGQEIVNRLSLYFSRPQE